MRMVDRKRKVLGKLEKVADRTRRVMDRAEKEEDTHEVGA